MDQVVLVKKNQGVEKLDGKPKSAVVSTRGRYGVLFFPYRRMSPILEP